MAHENVNTAALSISSLFVTSMLATERNTESQNDKLYNASVSFRTHGHSRFQCENFIHIPFVASLFCAVRSVLCSALGGLSLHGCIAFLLPLVFVHSFTTV